jgi:hypothetical protein
MRTKDTAAGKPAVILPGIATEQDRAIVARREAGDTRRAVCEALGVTVAQVQRAERRCENDDKGRGLLTECADSIEGLKLIGAMDRDAAWTLLYHHACYDSPPLTRLSEVAALGPHYWSKIEAIWRPVRGTGKRQYDVVSDALALLGIAWSPIDRTPKPKAAAQQQERQPATSDSSAWSRIVRRVGEIEQIMGTGFFEGDPHRDSIECVAGRLAFLTGYIEGYVEKRRPQKPMRDITPEADSGQDLETAGNLICLPGVKLADVQPFDGGRA